MVDCMLRNLLHWGHFGRQLGRLHAELHSLSAPSFSSQNERLHRRLESSTLLPQEMKQALLTLLATKTEEDAICHGDFHPQNLILSRDGPIIIDWKAVCTAARLAMSPTPACGSTRR
jgi:Ser/Thr protein kinase RdoA (MazF antagonist)